MRWFFQLAMKIRMLFGRAQATARLDEELRFHLERQIAENVAAGKTAAEARLAALRSFGNPALLREQTRATWNWTTLELLMHDMRYGVRTLLRTPGFAAVAVLIMALGIGANVALFTVVRSVLLNPLPYRASSELISIYEAAKEVKGNNSFMPVDAGSFASWQRSAQGVAQMTMVSPWQQYNVSAESGKLPEQIDAAWCSWNFFSTLGVSPYLGRTFTAADDRPDAESTVVLSNSFWKRRLDGDPAVVNKKIWLDAKPYTVIGVLPSSDRKSTRLNSSH